MAKSIIIGSSGQIGTDLIQTLGDEYGTQNVLATDIKQPQNLMEGVSFQELNALDFESLKKTVQEFGSEEVYLLAAMLSATAERFPLKGWELNMQTLFNVLELAKEGIIKKVFFPSSIAVFGSTTPGNPTPQKTIIEPETVYGISKQAGEQWCAYYHQKYGVDVRSIRYPGLISYKAEPGGGTTDYAVKIFYDALQGKSHNCFLQEDTRLPMMYMPDAIRGTREIMRADRTCIKMPNSYNLTAFSFTPIEIYEAIKSHIPSFKITFEPDFRQAIAASWPQVIDDTQAQKDWGWKPQYDLNSMVEDMLTNLEKKFSNK